MNNIKKQYRVTDINGKVSIHTADNSHIGAEELTLKMRNGLVVAVYHKWVSFEIVRGSEDA